MISTVISVYFICRYGFRQIAKNRRFRAEGKSTDGQRPRVITNLVKDVCEAAFGLCLLLGGQSGFLGLFVLLAVPALAGAFNTACFVQIVLRPSGNQQRVAETHTTSPPHALRLQERPVVEKPNSAIDRVLLTCVRRPKNLSCSAALDCLAIMENSRLSCPPRGSFVAWWCGTTRSAPGLPAGKIVLWDSWI